MTAAQKIAKEKFKKAIAYRKKTGCSLKQAFAHVYGNKSVGAIKKKTAPKKKSATKKKAVAKKKATTKKKSGSYHKDTQSHNVNIRVISGIDKNDNKILNEIKFLKNDIIYYENAIKRIKKELPVLTSGEKLRAKRVIKNFTLIKNEKKVHINQLKKYI